MKRKAEKSRVLLREIPLDREGWSLKVHEIEWADGTRCVQVMKYVGKEPYYPLQYLQVPAGLLRHILLGALPGAGQTKRYFIEECGPGTFPEHTGQ